MKKLILSSVFLMSAVTIALAQCTPGILYEGGVAPAPGGSTTMTTCAYAGEYQTVTGVVSGDDYVLTYTGGAGNYITVWDASWTAVAWGVSPLSWTASGSGTYYSQANLDGTACGTDFDCHTGVWYNSTGQPISTFPYFEDFESGAANWSVTGGVWALGTPTGTVINSAGSGVNSWCTVLAGNYPNSANAWVESPVFDFSAVPNPSIQMQVWWNSELSWDGTNLQSSIDAGATWQTVGNVGDPNNWYTDGTINGNPGGSQLGWTGSPGSGGWVNASHDLSGTGGNPDVRLRFAFGSDGSVNGYDGFAFDDVNVFNVTCAAPSALNASSVTTSSADLGWTSTESLWNVEYGLAGFALGTGTQIIGTTNNPENITGLTGATQYEFYVQADCGSGTSVWSGPFAFTTPFQPPNGVSCSTGGPEYVFSDDMETGTGWTGDIGLSAGQWDFPTANPGGNSTNTGPSGPASGTTYAEYEASGSQAIASMVTPMIDLTSGFSGAELSFYMHAYGAEMGTLNVGVGTSPTGPFTTEFTWSGQFQTAATDPWVQVGVDLAAYLGQQIYIEFSYGALGPNWYGDMSIDLVEVVTCSTCPAPTSLNATYIGPDTLIVSWTNGLSETSWNYEYGPFGYTPGTGTTGVFDSNPDTIVGVSPNALYDFYLQSDCITDQSYWQGPIMVSTLQNDDACDAVLVPVDGSTTTYSNFGATGQIGEPGSPENSVWFKAVVPASGHMAIGTCGENFDTELNVYSVTNCNDFTTYTDLGYADFNPWNCTGLHPAGIELCGLTPLDTVYFWVDGWFGSEGTFPLRLWDLEAIAGTGGTVDVCIGDTLNLWTTISGQNSNDGFWDYPNNPVAITNDSLFISSNASVGGDMVYYILSNACDSDTTAATVNVLLSSNAGEDGVLDVCMNQPIDLLSGLGGNVDLGGTWYDPSNNPISSSIIASSIPGQFNYDYITSNGVCPEDTSNVVVNVLSSCDYLDLESIVFGNITIHPNPTSDIVSITNIGSNALFDYELTDINGRLIQTEEDAINSTETTEVSLGEFDPGVYFIRIFNNNAEKTFRVVKE